VIANSTELRSRDFDTRCHNYSSLEEVRRTNCRLSWSAKVLSAEVQFPAAIIETTFLGEFLQNQLT
jgi:hypothetical protein